MAFDRGEVSMHRYRNYLPSIRTPLASLSRATNSHVPRRLGDRRFVEWNFTCRPRSLAGREKERERKRGWLEGIKRNRWITIKMINDLRSDLIFLYSFDHFQHFSMFFQSNLKNGIANFINFIQCDISNGLLFFIMLPWPANSLDMNI